MNILFLTIARISDINGRGIYTDLMRKFRNEGHQVYIVTPFERKCNLPTSLSIQDGIHILGVKTLNIQKTNIVEKGLGTITIESLFYRAIQKYFKDVYFDLILYSTPPITFSNIVRKLKKKHHAVTYLLLKDIFPQNAVDLQMFSQHSIFYWYFRRKEIQLYKESDFIGCMSPANVDFVKAHNPFVTSDKIEVAPNSIELSEETVCIDKDGIKKKYGLPVDKPIFIYGGNLGKPQGLDFLLQVLEENLKRDDLFFLIVGSGTEYQKIAEWFDTFSPSNAKLMQGLPKHDYDNLVRSCDVGLIFLDPRFTIPNYPSRLLSYLEYKMPILAATDKNTDIGTIAEENGYGYYCVSGDIDSFDDCLDKLIDQENRQKMGENGFQFLKRNYQVDNTYRVIMAHF